jgi:hypothetical protein
VWFSDILEVYVFELCLCVFFCFDSVGRMKNDVTVMLRFRLVSCFRRGTRRCSYFMPLFLSKSCAGI